MNKIVQTFKNGKSISTIERAQGIAKSLGAFTAARYLSNRGYSIEGALFIICSTTYRE